MSAQQVSPLPDSADPTLHELFRRWAKLAERGRLPSAGEMDLDALFTHFPGAALIEVQKRPASGARYCFIRAGSGFAPAFGREIEGYSVDELVSLQQIAHFESVFDRIVAGRRPHYWMRMNPVVNTRPNTLERLLVPVSEDNETVDALVGMWNWIDV